MVAAFGLTWLIATIPAPAAPQRDLGTGAVLGVQIDPVTVPAFCDRLHADGSKSVIVFLSRGVIERGDGTLNTAGIENRVGPDLACGLNVAVRVKPTSSPDQDSYLPTGTELTQYLSLLTQLSTYLDGRVQRYAIDNETAAVSHFAGTADDYFTLLRASAAALRAGDPDAEILDGTMASGNMTAVMVADLYSQGRYAEAIALAQETQANELGGGAPVTDQASLEAYVNDSRVQRSIQFFAGAVANQSSYDAFQLHYYGPWRGLPRMIDYVRSHGITLPIEVWEVAHRYRDGRPFDEGEHADETARLLTAAVGEGSAWTDFSSYLGSADNGAVGLLGFDGAIDHQARYAFRTVTGELTGATSARRLALGGDAWGYRFERPGDYVVVAWSDPAPARTGSGKLGIAASTAAVVSAGNDRTRHVRLSRLRLDGTPRFIEPDSLELDQVGRRARHHRLRLRLACPPASATSSCRGEITVRSRGRARSAGKRNRGPQTLAKVRYRVERGAHRRLRVRLHGSGRPAKAIAMAKRCPVGGRGGCRSWTKLR